GPLAEPKRADVSAPAQAPGLQSQDPGDAVGASGSFPPKAEVASKDQVDRSGRISSRGAPAQETGPSGTGGQRPTVRDTFAPDDVREGAHRQDLWQKARALTADRRAARPLQPWQQKDLLPPSRTPDGTMGGVGGIPPSAAGRSHRPGACPVPKGAGALDTVGRPESDPCEENLSGDERRWLVQGTIQSMPAPVREPSPARSRSPAPRREGIEAQPLYDLLQQMREMWSTQAAQQG
ncbi:unnamed protein product, partial [Cladocopium goreaui]